MMIGCARPLSLYAGGLSMIALALAAPGAIADEAAGLWTCQVISDSHDDPIGDGHALDTISYSCRIEGGPLNGGMVNGTEIAEWTGGKYARIAAMGVVRKPGAIAIYSGGSASSTPTMENGKVTGWVGVGKDDYVFGSGDWAFLAGKSSSFTCRNAAAGFTCEVRFD
jgi:hypothetical protein